jgi:quinol monooxygenase YgiN
MIQAQIQQFLDAPGRKAFSGWLRFFAKVARQFDGFINLQLQQIEGDSSLCMVVIFEEKAKLDAFISSPVFGQLMSKMDKHAIKPYKKSIYRSKNLYDYRLGAQEAKDKEESKIIKPTPDQIGASAVKKRPTKVVVKPAEAAPKAPAKVVGLNTYKKRQAI